MGFRFYSIVGGLFLIALGAILWLSNMGVLRIMWRRDWPIILVAIGVMELLRVILKR